MARQSNELVLAWSSLISEEGREGWQSIALEPSGQIAICAGRKTPANSEAVLIGFSSLKISSSQTLPEGNGFSFEVLDFDGDSKTWFAISRKHAGGLDLFTSMACDVINTIDNAVARFENDVEKLADICIRRVSAWQEFMKRGIDVLSPEEELGLVGELQILNKLIACRVSPQSVVNSWVGPIRGLQDFAIGTGAIEVKSTLSEVSFLAKIGSLMQLDDTERSPIFVAGVRLKLESTGVTLPEMVALITETLHPDWDAENTFAEKLIAAGFHQAHSVRYGRRFQVVEIRILKVDSSFPRLTPSSVPAGIHSARYEINLDNLAANTLSLDVVLKDLGIL